MSARRVRAGGPDVRARAGRERGFTLIEILIALMVFMAGITGILALLSTGVVLHREGLDAARTPQLVEDVAAALQREVAAHALYDPVTRTWSDLRAGFDPRTGRLVALEAVSADPALVAVAVDFVPEIGNERDGTLLAHIRIHPRTRGLDDAAALPFLLQPGPTVAAALSAGPPEDR